MIAHIRKADGTRQSIREHSENTARLARESLESCGLGTLAYLAGLLHDMGKCTARFSQYLLDIHEASLRGERYTKHTSPHAPAGAIFVYERYWKAGGAGGKAAQIIAMAILGHHSGLCDCLDRNSDLRSPFLEMMSWDKAEICYAEAERNYLAEVADPEQLDGLFESAVAELTAFTEKAPKGIGNFSLAMTARLLLGALADADRWDSACFDNAVAPFEAMPAPKWSEWKLSLENHLRGLNPNGELSAIRAGICARCREAGEREGAGIYRLTVPTGGGKTFSATLFALTQAVCKRVSTERLFYVAPFNAILCQNAKAIRDALGEDEQLLEHYGDAVIDDDAAKDSEESEPEQEYRICTERWTSRIILTSMVQLLDTLFKGSNTNARRLPKLSHSIIIFDEVQSLPRKCTVLFECACRYLAQCLDCTIVLCTATQPELREHSTDMLMTAAKMNEKPLLGEELLPDVTALFDKLRRVRFVDERSVPRSYEQAAEDTAEMLRSGLSVLMVVNTKKAASDILGKLKAAGGLGDTVLIHLTTNMCVAQRKEAIERMLAALDDKRRNPDAPCVCCISTALIEAGVDISFPVVIRSSAGLPSILQAAGRCNRNREAEFGLVYIWRLPEEVLKGLPEIRQAQQDSDAILDKAALDGQSLDTPENVASYFRRVLLNDLGRPKELFYPVKDSSGGLYIANLLGKNTVLSADLQHRKQNPLDKLSLRCSWRIAGKNFQVIDEDTVALIAPYKEGKEIIERLCSGCSYKEEKLLLKKAQHYTVNAFRGNLDKLIKLHAVYPLGETGALAIADEYYNPEIGLVTEQQEMKPIIL